MGGMFREDFPAFPGVAVTLAEPDSYRLISFIAFHRATQAAIPARKAERSHSSRPESSFEVRA